MFVFVHTVIAAAIRCSGVMFEVPLAAAAAAEPSMRSAVPPVPPGLASEGWVASPAAVATASITAPISGFTAEPL